MREDEVNEIQDYHLQFHALAIGGGQRECLMNSSMAVEFNSGIVDVRSMSRPKGYQSWDWASLTATNLNATNLAAIIREEFMKVIIGEIRTELIAVFRVLPTY